jgi:hypothetical protein
MNQDIITLYDEYSRGGMDRRAFLDRLAQVVGGAAAALALLPALEAGSGQDPIVAPDDKRLVTGKAEYDAAGTKMTGYLARQVGGKKRPAVIVISENRGLNAHIEDVARRFAVEGFLAFAPDPLSQFGGTPADPAEVSKLFGSLNAAETAARLAAAVKFLATHTESTGKVGVVGFCWGGGLVNRLAAGGGRRAEDLVPADAALRVGGCADQRRHPRLRGGAQGAQEDVRALHVRRGRPRLQQQHGRPLSQGIGGTGVEAHAGVLQQVPEVRVRWH